MRIIYTLIKWHFIFKLFIEDNHISYVCVYDDCGKIKKARGTLNKERFESIIKDMVIKQMEADR